MYIPQELSAASGCCKVPCGSKHGFHIVLTSAALAGHDVSSNYQNITHTGTSTVRTSPRQCMYCTKTELHQNQMHTFKHGWLGNTAVQLLNRLPGNCGTAKMQHMIRAQEQVQTSAYRATTHITECTILCRHLYRSLQSWCTMTAITCAETGRLPCPALWTASTPADSSAMAAAVAASGVAAAASSYPAVGRSSRVN